jgi:signal transduction histidine kinase
MNIRKPFQNRPILNAALIALGYILLGGMYIYFSTGWAHGISDTIEEFASLERFKDTGFIFFSGLVLLIFSFFLFYRLSRYNNRILRQQEVLLESEQRAMAGMFAASVAHDATNILTSLRFCLELLSRETQLNGGSSDLVKTMRTAIQQLSSLNQRLLDSSKRGISGELTEVNLVDEIEKTMRLAQANQRVQHCVMNLEVVETEEPFVFKINPLLVNDMLLNLILNAGDAVQSDGGKILVKMEQSDRYAVIEVHDSGPGVPESMKEKIFDPFFTTKKTGSGLGLLTVKACAECHKGWVEVLQSSRLGGALFRIWLPMHKAPNTSVVINEDTLESEDEIS